jgi:hypothetical protein
MLVEIPLIQRFNLLVGNVAGLAVVTARCWSAEDWAASPAAASRSTACRVSWPLPDSRVVVALSPVLVAALVDWALPFGLGARLAVTAAALLPLGALMGMPFPSGLRIADQADPRGVAAFWGANAVTSVLGTAAAMALAVTVGFSAALWLGAGLYAVAALVALLIWPRLV